MRFRTEEGINKVRMFATDGSGLMIQHGMRPCPHLKNEKLVKLDQFSSTGNLHAGAGIGGGRHVLVQSNLGDISLAGRLLKQFRIRRSGKACSESNAEQSRWKGVPPSKSTMASRRFPGKMLQVTIFSKQKDSYGR